jgi:hypothetical protein
LLNAVIGFPYTVNLHASGGTGTLTWTLVAGNFPPWLSLNSTTGVLSGTPTDFGQTGVSVQVTDSGSPHQAANTIFTLFVQRPLAIGLGSIVLGNRNIPYNSSVFAENGTNATTFSVTAGNPPPGLTLNANGTITGTPTQSGSFVFTVQAIDPGPPQQTATTDVTIQIQDLLVITNFPTFQAIEGRPYSSTLQTVNGTAPLHWTAIGLPAGLTINATTGVISGTPTQANFVFPQIAVSDSSVPVKNYSNVFQIDVFGILKLTSTNLGNANIGQFFSTVLPITGGAPPVTFTITSGAPPPGLSLINNSFINGVPTQLGDFSFDVNVQDGASPPQTAQATVTLHVLPKPPVVTLVQFPRGIVGRAYSASLAAQFGTPPYSWSISSGNLPPGLVLDSQGEITGPPTGAGTFSFTALVTDSGAPVQTATGNFSIQILAHALGRNDSIATATPVTSAMLPLNASISPFSDPSTNGSDGDYYSLTANPGTPVSVAVVARRLFAGSMLDSVVEIVDSTGSRFTTCNDPIQQFLSAPAVLDPNPTDFNNPCINDDDPNTNSTDSTLQFKVPGTSGPPVTFYIHVIDFRGDARPDMVYQLQIGGAN